MARTSNEVSRAIGRRIRALRNEAGMSQDKLAEAIGVSKWSISAWERGTGIPEFPSLENIAEQFKTTVPFLIGSTDEREAPPADQDTFWGKQYALEEANTIGECVRMLTKLSEPMKRVVISTIRTAYAQDEAAGILQEPSCNIDVTVKR